MYYQVLKLKVKLRVLTSDDTQISSFLNSFKISDIDQLILELIFRFGVIWV